MDSTMGGEGFEWGIAVFVCKMENQWLHQQHGDLLHVRELTKTQGKNERKEYTTTEQILINKTFEFT